MLARQTVPPQSPGFFIRSFYAQTPLQTGHSHANDYWSFDHGPCFGFVVLSSDAVHCLEYGGIMTKQVLLKPGICKWMLDNQDIYMAGDRYDHENAHVEIPVFMLGILSGGVPGTIGPKNDVNCYKFTSTVTGLKNISFFVDREDVVVLR